MFYTGSRAQERNPRQGTYKGWPLVLYLIIYAGNIDLKMEWALMSVEKRPFISYLMLKIGLYLKEITADLMKIPFSEMCSYCKLHSSSSNPLGMWN